MNKQHRFSLKSLLWGCMYFTLAIIVFTGEAVDAFNITISPLNSTNHLSNDSSGEHKNYKVTSHISDELENNEIREHLSNTNETVSDVDETRGNSSATGDKKKGTSEARLNLAVIPALAILVFVIGFCLKGCSWFRQYTRGSKDTPEYYDIVEEGDTDFDRIEMRTDSASTVYYDTVSSFCSFLRKNDPDVTALTLNGSRFEQLKEEYDVSDKLLKDVRRKMAELDAIDRELEVKNSREQKLQDNESLTELEIDENQTDTSKLLTYPQKPRVTRTPSGSSDVSVETEQSLLSDTDKETPIKRQRFKVSFVTETFDSGKPNKQLGDVNNLRPIINNSKVLSAKLNDNADNSRPNFKSVLQSKNTPFFTQSNQVNTTSSKETCTSYPEQETCRNKSNGVRPKISPISTKRSFKGKLDRQRPSEREKTFVFRKGPYRFSRSISYNTESVSKADIGPETKEIATQTDKSFRLSFKKGRKRYSSESYADENAIPPTISELVEMCSCVTLRNDAVVANDKACICGNYADDICDDVFERNEVDVTPLFPATPTDPLRKMQTTDIRTDSENRHTNHEWNNGDNLNSCNNKDFVRGTIMTHDFNATTAVDIRDKMSVSTHNISEVKNGRNGNILEKYCDKYQNLNNSVPNVCFPCQNHPFTAEYNLTNDMHSDAKNRCQSWSYSRKQVNLQGQTSNTICISKTKQCKSEMFKRESSLASEDLSLSTSSLSSSGYVENSSDMSSS